MRKVDSHPRSQNSPSLHTVLQTHRGVFLIGVGYSSAVKIMNTFFPSSDPHLGQHDEHGEHLASLVEGTNNTEDTRDKKADCDERFPSPDIHQEGTEEVSRNLNKTNEDKTEAGIS